MAVVNKFNVNKQEVTLNADIIENMSANDVSYDASTQYDENTVGDKLSELEYDVTANNDGVTFATLSELLSSKNLSTFIPTSVRHGGMSIRFVQSSDNKYVQYFLTKNVWSANEGDWEKMNLEEEEVSQLGHGVYKTLSSISEINLSGVNLPYAINVDISSVKTKSAEINIEIKDVTSCLYDLYLINPNNQNDFVVIERSVNTAEYTYKYDDDGTHTEFRIYFNKIVGASLLRIFVPVDIVGIIDESKAVNKYQKTELYNSSDRRYYFIINGAYTKNDCEIRFNSAVNLSYDLYWFDADTPNEYTLIFENCTSDFVKIPLTSPYTHFGIYIYIHRDDIVFESISVAYTTTMQYILNTIHDVETRVEEDVNELEQKFNKFEQPVELGSLNNGYIDTNGNVVSSQSYSYTNPILFNLDTQIRITYRGTMMAVASITDKEGSVYTPIIIDTNEDAISKKTQYLDIAANSYVSFCGRWLYSEFIEVVEFDSLTRAFNEKVKFQVEENNKYINEELNIVSGSHYFYTKPIPIKRGETVWVYIKGGLCTSIASAQVDGTLEKALVYNNSTNGETFKNFYYSAQTDMCIVVCGKYYNQTLIKVGRDCAIAKLEDSISKLEDSLFRKFHSGIYIYPFRAIVGKRVMLYKDSIASGLKPSNLYQVDCVRGDNMQNYSWNALSFLPETAGEQNINIQVSDVFNEKINKTIKVTSFTMPSSKLQNSSPIDVFWMGDSLIGFNGNLIGAEWYRMLATDDSESHIDSVTKAIQLPTLNICPGKINLVGENSWEARYMYVYSLKVLMQGNRSIPYNPNMGHTTYSNMNPWYNPDSTEPNEVGEDGFNKRVDLPWYFNNACGSGRYPKLFYIAIGANDIASQGWGFELVPQVTANFVKLCKKIKTECDKIAGGDSGIKIKVLNHQTYPLHNMYSYEFDTLQQRLVWNLLYDSYFEAINNTDNGISDYVELIDCASRFDWRVGYTQTEIKSNPRYNEKQDIFISECCHMNNVGAFNYADALIDDFLADSDFD